MDKTKPLALRHCRPVTDAPGQRWQGELHLPGESLARDVLVIARPHGYVAIPRRCAHEGYDLSRCVINADGQIVCPLHGQSTDTRPDACTSWPAHLTDTGFVVAVDAKATPSAAAVNDADLLLELASLRQANAALESELLANAETLDGLIETLHKQQEQLRRRTREIETLNGFMERAIDTMGELFFLLHPDGRIRQANTLAIDELGLTAQDLFLEQFLPQEEREAIARVVAQNPGECLLLSAIRAHGGRYEAELRLSRADGRAAYPYLVRGALLHSPAGKLEGAVVIASNIAALKEREQAARDNEAMFRLTASAAQDAIVLIDAKDRVLFWNHAAESIFGYQSHEALGKNLHELIMAGHFPPEVSRGLAQFHDSGRGSVLGSTREIIGRTKDGRRLTIELGVSAVEIKGKWHAIGLMRDITQRKQAEAELLLHRDHLADLVGQQTHDLLLAKDAAEAANQAKSEFIANMSHELRTPMHAILSFSRMGMDKADKASKEKISHYFDNIHTSGKRLTSLIDDLLDLSKLEAGRMEVFPQQADIADLVVQAQRELKSLFIAKRIGLHLECDGATSAWVDASRFSQVLINLLSNALRFSPEGGSIRIHLFASSLPDGAGGEQPALCMAVADDGPGIPDEDLESIFDKFVQSSRTKTGAGGTGLGLSICRKIIHLLHGSITAQHAAGGGACIEVRVPTQAWA